MTKPTQSSPDKVFAELKRYKSKNGIRETDEFCLVIDRDRWGDAKLSEIAQGCDQQQFFLALSNPCFELWLLLHLEEVLSKGQTYLDKAFTNRNGFLKSEVRRALGGSFNPSNLKFEDFKEGLDSAITRAEAMDSDPGSRWPQNLGTRVYQVIKKIRAMV